MLQGRRPGNALQVLIGAGAIFVVAAAAALVAPVMDMSASGETLPPAEARGQQIYSSEGCAYCHTQQVRPVSNDVGLGLATRPQDVRGSDGSVVGWVRVGPDLACYGDRALDGKDLAEYLRDPRASRPASIMPRLDHLDEKQMGDLVAYLLSLDCKGGK